MRALDVMRGITVAAMILVNNPGSWSHVFAPLRHAEWHGLTPTDLVFPFFMFIMGITTAMSLRRYNFTLSRPLAAKILRRTVVIFLIGMIIDRIAAFCWGTTADGPWLTGGLGAALDCSHIRILGVLQRLALCYFFAAIIGALCSRRVIRAFIIVALAAYSAILLLCHGLEFTDDNIIGVIDRALFGENHMYHQHAFGQRLAFDPEGLLSTLPSIAHTLIGFLAGRMILSTKDLRLRMLNLFVAGTAMMFAGLMLSYGLPINKNIWSPTFVLTTCGMASAMLALLIWVIDVKGSGGWSRPFDVFGINPLFLYVLSDVIALVLAVTAGDAPYQFFVGLLHDPTVASLAYSLSFVGLNWLIGYPLYRRSIIIKI